MEINFTVTKYKRKGEPEVLSETVTLPNGYKQSQIIKALLYWSELRGFGDGDYTWEYEEV